MKSRSASARILTKNTLVAFLAITISVTGDFTHADTTNPPPKDSDGDGYFDGPDCWTYYPTSWGRVLRAGEDKNGNGKYEPAGADGIAGNKDDESDPHNPDSMPRSEQVLNIDSDCDGLTDDREESERLNIHDRDTDDDGLTDGWECLGRTTQMEAYVYELDRELLHGTVTKPELPDTDWDGRPDGLEVGVTTPIPSLRSGENELLGTDIDAVYTRYAEDLVERPGIYKCFVADSDQGNPGSATSPVLIDSNNDGKSDLLQDTNSNGTYDAGEEDPVFGIGYSPESSVSGYGEVIVSCYTGNRIGVTREQLVFKSGMQTGAYSIEILGGHLGISPTAVSFQQSGSEVALETSAIRPRSDGSLVVRNAAGVIVYSAVAKTGPNPNTSGSVTSGSAPLCDGTLRWAGLPLNGISPN